MATATDKTSPVPPPPPWRAVLARLEEELAAETRPARKGLLLYEIAEILERDKKDVEEASKRLVAAVNLLPSLVPAVSSLLRIHASRRSLKNLLKLLGSEKRALASFKEAPRILAAEGGYRWVFGETREAFAPPLEKAIEMHPEAEEALLFLAAGTARDPATTVQALGRWSRVAGDPRIRAALLGAMAFASLRSGDHSVAYQALADIASLRVDARDRLHALLLKSSLSGACGLHEDQAAALEEAAALLAGDPKPDGMGDPSGGAESVRETAAGLLRRSAWIRMAELGQNATAIKVLSRAREVLPDAQLLAWERAVIKAREGSFDELKTLAASAGPAFEDLVADLAVLTGMALPDRPHAGRSTPTLYTEVRRLELARLGMTGADDAADALAAVPASKVLPPAVTALVQTRLAWDHWTGTGATAPLVDAAMHDPDLVPPDLAARLLAAGRRLDSAAVEKLSADESGTPARRLSRLALLAREARRTLERPELAHACYERAAEAAPRAVWPLLLASLDRLEAGDLSAAARDWLSIAERLKDTPDGLDFKAAAAWLLSRQAFGEPKALELLDQVLASDPAHPLAAGGRTAILLRSEGWEALDRALEEQAAASLKPEENARLRMSRALVQAGRLDRPEPALDLALQALSAAGGAADDPDRASALALASRFAERSRDPTALEELLERLAEAATDGSPVRSLAQLGRAELAAFSDRRTEEALEILSQVKGDPDLRHAAEVQSLFLQAADPDRMEFVLGPGPTRDLPDPTRFLEAALSAGGALGRRDMAAFARSLAQASAAHPRGDWGWTLLQHLAPDPEHGPSPLPVESPPEVRFAFHMLSSAERSGTDDAGAGPEAIDETLSPSDLDATAVVWAADRADTSWSASFRVGLFSRRALMEEGERKGTWLVELAEAYTDLDDVEKAAETYAEALRLGPGSLAALKGLSKTAWLSGRFEDAASAELDLADFAGTPAEAAAACLRAAEMWAQAERPDEQEKALRAGLERDPGHAGCFVGLIEALRHKGEHGEMQRLLEARVATDDDPEALSRFFLDLADARIALDKPEAALEALENLLLLQPGRPDALRLKAHLFLEQERWPDLLAVVDELAGQETEPCELKDLWLRAAEVAERELGDVDRALGYLEGLLARGDDDPATAQALLDLAERHHLPAEAAEARAELARIALLQGDRCTAAVHLAREADLRLKDLSDREGGQATLLTLLDVTPTDLPRLEQWMALDPPPPAEEIQRRLHRAAGELRAAFLESPADPAPLEALVRLMALRKEPEGERLVAEVLAALKPRGAASPTLRPYAWRDPAGPLDPSVVSQIRHPGDGGPIHRVALAVAPHAFDIAASSPGGAAEELSPWPADHEVARHISACAEALAIHGLKIWKGGDALSLEAVSRPGLAVRVGAEVPADLTSGLAFGVGRAVILASIGAPAVRGDPDRLAALAAAACLAADVPLRLGPLGERALALKDAAQKHLPRKVRKEIAALSEPLAPLDDAAFLTWARAAILSADRYGLVLSGDLATALQAIRAAGEAGTPLSADERGEALRAFAVSDEILRARRALGLLKE